MEIPGEKISEETVPELTFESSGSSELIVGQVKIKIGNILGVLFDMRGFGFDITGIGTAAFPSRRTTYSAAEITSLPRQLALKGRMRQGTGKEIVIQVPPEGELHTDDQEDAVWWEVSWA